MLRGERVLLRAVQREDLDGLWDLFEDLELTARWSDRPPVPWSREDWVSRFERHLGEMRRDDVEFAIEAEGAFIGKCGLQHVDHYRGLAELGIALGRDHWGKGYGQDAVRTLLEYAFRHLNLRKVWLKVLADDARAVGAYKKVGFVEEGRLREDAWFDGAHRDSLVMGILREEWESPGSTFGP